MVRETELVTFLEFLLPRTSTSHGLSEIGVYASSMNSMTSFSHVGQMWDYWMMGGWGWMMFIWIIFIALIVAGIYFLVVAYRPRVPSERRGDRALEIARERLARGEITPEEFERIKKTLSGGE